MSDALLLEFSGVSADKYAEVNGILGLDPDSGTGDWPDGMVSHTGASSGDGVLVFEVWESRDAQEAFMSSRRGPALEQAGLPAPQRIEWFSVLGHATP